MFKKILVAVDDSEPGAAALDLAIELGKTMGSSLTLIYALDPTAVAASADITSVSAVEIEVEELQKAGQSALDSAVARVKGAGLTVTPILRDGVAAPTIVDAAIANQVDLIVVGTHGREGIARFFLGSVAEHVLREAPMPVLVKRV